MEILDTLNMALAMLPSAMDTPTSRVLLLAIGYQESRMYHRRQLIGNPPKPIGPAKGLWQFERSGGCKGVIEHPSSRYWMHKACIDRGVVPNATALWNALEIDDVLAVIAARLLIFTDPRKLPNFGDELEAWNLYLRTWRPGKPHRTTWSEMYSQAVELAK